MNKGAIPYGDHPPWPDMRTTGSAPAPAVLFDLLGDREAADFFAKMSTAAYSERERGHTGNFFNLLWALPGVARCGPLATGAYLKEQAWYYDLARGWDGSFLYQGSPAGEEEHRIYKDWDCTRGLSAGLRAAAEKPPSHRQEAISACRPSTAAQVEEVIAAGRDYGYNDDEELLRSAHRAGQLLAGLSSWSPAVRTRSAQALGRREGNFTPTLLKLLAGLRPRRPLRSLRSAGCLGPRADTAAPQLRALLNDPDPWLQSLACVALASLSAEARKASVSDLLRMTVSSTPPTRGTWPSVLPAWPCSLPIRARREPKSILAESLEGVDRQVALSGHPVGIEERRHRRPRLAAADLWQVDRRATWWNCCRPSSRRLGSWRRATKCSATASGWRASTWCRACTFARACRCACR